MCCTEKRILCPRCSCWLCRLLTSFFTLAYLMAPHAAHIVRTMLLMQHSRQAAWAATAAEGVSHTYHSGGAGRCTLLVRCTKPKLKSSTQ